MFLIALSKTTRGESEAIPLQHKTHPILEIDWNEGTSIPETLLERDDFKLNPPGANRTIHIGLEEVDENLHAPSDENITTQIPFLTTSETSASIEHLDAPPTSSDEETTEESRDNILDLFSVEEEDNFFIPFNPKDQEVQFFQSAKKGKTKRKPEVVEMNGIITSRAKVSLDSTLSNDNTELQEDLTSASSDPNRNKTSHLEKHDQQDFGSESSDQHYNATNNSEKNGQQEVTLDKEHIDFKVFSEGSEKVPKALGDTTTSQKNLKDSQSTQMSELLNSNTKTNDDREKVQLDSQSHADVSEGHSENASFSGNYSVTEEVLELKHLDDNHKLPSASDEYKSDHNYNLNIYSLDSSSGNTTFSPFRQEQLAYFVPNLEDVFESGQNSSQNTFLDPFFIPVMHYDPSLLLPNRSEEPPAKDKETNTTTPKADLVALSSALAIDWGDMPAQYAVNSDFFPYRSTKYAFPYTASLQNHDPTPSGPLNTQDTLDEHNDHFHVSDKRPIKLPTGKVYKNSKTFRDFGSETKAFHQLNHDPGSDEMFDNDSKSVTASENDNESVRMSDNDSTSFELSDNDPVSGEVSGNVGESSKILRSSGQIFRSSRYYNQDSMSSNHTSPFQRLFRHSKGNIRPFRYFNPTSFESKKIFKSNHSSSTSNHSGNESASLKGASSDPKSFKGLTIDAEGHNVTDHLSLLNYSNSNPLKNVSNYSKLLEAKDIDTKTFSDTEHEPRSTEDLDHDDSIKFVDYFEYEGQPGEDENTTSKAIDPHMDISLEAQDKEDTPESALRHLRAIPLHLGIPKIPSFFAFKYLVDDLEGNYFGHQEARDIYSAKGKYFVLLPDGRLQTVNYLANRTGYFPHIVYTPGKESQPDLILDLGMSLLLDQHFLQLLIPWWYQLQFVHFHHM
ncbi:uncharacterized protein LOC135225448 [Macrobrachium nipponense]|uniref:uncharacterized protein LOC135225448 n=1 Tax=Macrobrachium nipponense TaxID=159736 RepID=UPI0030C8866D